MQSTQMPLQGMVLSVTSFTEVQLPGFPDTVLHVFVDTNLQNSNSMPVKLVHTVSGSGRASKCVSECSYV